VGCCSSNCDPGLINTFPGYAQELNFKEFKKNIGHKKLQGRTSKLIGFWNLGKEKVVLFLSKYIEYFKKSVANKFIHVEWGRTCKDEWANLIFLKKKKFPRVAQLRQKAGYPGN